MAPFTRPIDEQLTSKDGGGEFELSWFDEPVQVEAPPAAEVVEFTG